ncbi:HD domain-containing protein [Actinomyces trachealis]|uniref:HD domain-containing protein n=1 Tax=Actinomyces trachealis TaxID=2763540 RepID=UPI0018C656C0|nr:hypothetical protein [Actinomyces trachealis]
MGVIDAPQWLLPAFTRSVRALGATADPKQIQASCEALLERWSTPDRRFHNVRHVIDMLARVDELADESHNPDMIRIATWYHGCVFSLTPHDTYRRNGGEDEAASAAEAASDLQALGIPDGKVDRICRLILSLKRHNLEDDIDAMALNDADLGTLAVDPQLYKSYRKLVRAEYEHVPDLDYFRARREIVTKLLGREKLFSSPLGARWERPARENLQSELRHITSRLTEMEDAVPTPASATDLPRTSAPSSSVPAVAQPRRTQTFPSPTKQVSEPAAASAAREQVAAAPAQVAPPAPPVRYVSPVTAASAAVPVASAEEAGLLHSPSFSTGPELPERSGQTTASASVPPPVNEQVSSPALAAPEEALPADKDAPHTDKAPVPRAPAHTTSMESCAEDIEALLAKPTDPGTPLTRQEQAEAHRTKLCQLARAKSEAAKALREMRTASFPAIKEEIIQDGAGQL